MNNCICCACLDCGHEFVIGILDLLRFEKSNKIGELIWCGRCNSRDYECSWGIFYARHSSDSIEDVLKIWRKWIAAMQA